MMRSRVARWAWATLPFRWFADRGVAEAGLDVDVPFGVKVVVRAAGPVGVGVDVVVLKRWERG